jgi:hypothetical protein
MNNQRHYMNTAKLCARTIVSVLTNRKLSPVFSRFVLYEYEPTGNVWFVAELDVKQIDKLERYCDRQLLHQISTTLKGLTVLISNHIGLSYVVLLSTPTRLKQVVEFPQEYDKQTIPLGVTRKNPVHPRPEDLRNVLLAGATRSGKSNLLLQMAYTAWVSGHHIALADPQLNTFTKNWHPLSFGPIASTDEDLIKLLQMVQAEATKRLGLLHSCTTGSGLIATKIEEYNQNTPVPMPRLFIFIDEANTFLGDNSIQSMLTDIARAGLKVGIHVVMAAHSWRASDIPKGLSASFETRLTFKVNDRTSANVVMDSNIGDRAMKIRYPGRGLIRYNGQPMMEFQSYLMPTASIVNLLKNAGSNQPKSFIPDSERILMEKALQDQDGKLTIAELQGMGLQYREARSLLDQWAMKGWVVKDPQQNNARVLSDEIRLALASI